MLVEALVIALVEGAAAALTQRLLTSRETPVDIQSLVQDVAELKARAGNGAPQPFQVRQAVRTLEKVVRGRPGLEIVDHVITYAPSPGQSLGDVLYGLDEEIASLRRQMDSPAAKGEDVKVGSSNSNDRQDAPSILDGLDEEIAALRSDQGQDAVEAEQEWRP